MKILAASVVLSLSALHIPPAAAAAEFQGADAVLILAETPAAAAPGAHVESGELQQWHADLQSYREHTAAFSPDEAARGWLALFDRALKLPAARQERNFGSPVSSRLLEVFQVLPPPATWEALAAQVAARPLPKAGAVEFVTPVLQIITGTMHGNVEITRRGIGALKGSLGSITGANREYGLQYALAPLEQAFYAQTGDKAGALADFEARLASHQPGRDASLSQSEREMVRMSGLEVPDLLTLTDAPHAEALLKRVFATDLQSATFSGERTKALARKVAMGLGSGLKLAAWDLVDNLDSTALYELFDKRFPGREENDSTRHTAESYYLLGLIVAGRSDEARAIALKIVQTGGPTSAHQEDALSRISEGVLTDLAAKGYAKEVFQFFDRLLADHPALPYWESYTTAAVLAGETDAMLVRIKEASERPNLKPALHNQLRAAYGNALLAADRVAEALPILREHAAGLIRASNDKADGDNAESGSHEAMEAATALAVVGELLGDKALIGEQLDAIAGAAQKHPAAIAGVSGPSSETLAGIFLAAGRGAELESLLAANLAETTRTAAATRQQQGMMMPSEDDNGSPALAPLLSLTDLYYQAGRFGDVVALLDHAKGWGAADLAKLLASRSYYTGSKFGYQAARALQKTGQADAALRVVNVFLDGNGGSDPGYALLLELLPPDRAEARLNELFAGDQFEERPLIWRAVLQLGQNRLDDAEKSARQAISIDPSDGEEGRGDRMRAYAVLADVLERKGDGEKAGQLRKAVQAIRLSEDADRYHAAGFLTRAVGMYEKALGYFSDAYCIQSRLAIQLNALGKFDEAAAHYERAYELMPESFGRMESHCFGCERAFAGERAQGLAERVFQQLAIKQPDNARVHYLLGYLRKEQERPAEAAEEFRAAVRLDPDYINAWKQLAGTTDRPADTDQAELNLLRLDPRRKHDSAELSLVSDLKALWTAVEAAAKFAPAAPVNLYPLAASQAAREQERRERPGPTDETVQSAATNGLLQSFAGYHEDGLVPWMAVLRNRVVAQALPFLRKDLAGAPDSE